MPPRARAAAAAALAGLLAACPADEPAASATAPSPPARPTCATPAPALAEMLFAIGAGDHVVGVSRYCTHPPACRDLPRIGGMIDPNLEAIDALAPDLLLWQGRPGELAELARRRGLELEAFRIETLADVRAAYRRLGDLLERPEAAAAEVARLDAALEAARADAPADRPRTLLVLGRTPGDLGQLGTAGPGTFLTECLAAAGGANVAADLEAGWPLLTPEAVVERAPELIVELRTEPADAETAARLRADWAAFAGVPAVEAGRIAVVSGDELLTPGPRLDRVVAKLARAVHGELDVGGAR